MDQRYVVLIATTISSFLTPFMASAVNVAVPMIEKEFALEAVFLAWISTAFLLSAAMFLVPMGKLGDIKGRKKLFVFGVSVFAISALFCSISISGAMLVFFRFLQGIGAAMIAGTAIALVTSAFPPQERGKMLGINTSAVYLGLSSGPFFGGLITQFLGWRAVFAFPIFLALIPIYLVSKIKEEKIEVKDSFDFKGAILFSLALFLLIYGFSSLPKPLGFLLVLFGVLALISFVFVETKTPQPVLNVSLFRRNVVFAMSNLAALLNYSATFGVAFLLSLYLQIVKGLSPQDAGIVLLVQPVVMAILSPISGWISDRVEPRIVASIGMAITALSLFLFSLLDLETSIAVVVAYLFLIGFGFGLFSSPNTNAVMSSVEKKFYGIASATLATMRVVGQALSMGIVMLIFAITIGSEMVSESILEFMSAMKTAFLISGILCTFGVFASLARGRIH